MGCEGFSCVGLGLGTISDYNTNDGNNMVAGPRHYQDLVRTQSSSLFLLLLRVEEVAFIVEHLIICKP